MTRTDIIDCILVALAGLVLLSFLICRAEINAMHGRLLQSFLSL